MICVYRISVGIVNNKVLERECKKHRSTPDIRSPQEQRISEMPPTKAANAGQNERTFFNMTADQRIFQKRDQTSELGIYASSTFLEFLTLLWVIFRV